MKKFVRFIIGNLGCLSSIIALFFINYSELNWWKTTIIIFGVCCAIGIIIYSIIEYYREKPIVCKNDSETQEYLKDWINTDGKVTVLSRDLSWVDNNIKAIMKGKCADINIFAQKETSLTKELIASGCNVNYYGNNFEPKSRFTVIRANKISKQIAMSTEIKSKMRNKRIIHETKNLLYDEWLHSLSDDIINLLELRVSEKNKK